MRRLSPPSGLWRLCGNRRSQPGQGVRRSRGRFCTSAVTSCARSILGLIFGGGVCLVLCGDVLPLLLPVSPVRFLDLLFVLGSPFPLVFPAGLLCTLAQFHAFHRAFLCFLCIANLFRLPVLIIANPQEKSREREWGSRPGRGSETSTEREQAPGGSGACCIFSGRSEASSASQSGFYGVCLMFTLAGRVNALLWRPVKTGCGFFGRSQKEPGCYPGAGRSCRVWSQWV